MRHMGIAVVVTVGTLASVAPARASSFGGLTYTPPKGYVVEAAADHVTLTKVTGATLCSLTVFAVALTLDAPEAAAARSWKEAVGDRFQSAAVRPVAPLTTRRYTWQKLYDASTNTWMLVLVPPRVTARDGELGAAAGMPTAYVYAERTVPTWSVPP